MPTNKKDFILVTQAMAYLAELKVLDKLAY